MIARYSRKEMLDIFSEEKQIENWLLIEQTLLTIQAKDGVVPKAAGLILASKLRKMRKEKAYDLQRFRQLEEKTRHEFLAFLEMTAEYVDQDGKNDSAYLHLGATSSDILDTAMMLQLQSATQLLLGHFKVLLPLLKKRANAYQTLITIGRTHGMFAEPTSFGLKFLSWYAEGKRNFERLKLVLAESGFGKISGAVGNNSWIKLAQEEKILERLGLQRELVSTQVVPRDRIAFIVTQLALVGAWIERVCTEIRHLQRSEVSEVYEGFERSQKGSSAMPHKKNPIACENLVGCSRLLRTYINATIENCNLWHERDMSHSSVERVTLPDSFILLDYMLARFQSVIEKLEVDRTMVQKNRDSAGKKVLSGKLLTQLGLAGVPRIQAYEWVQKAALGQEKNLRKAFEGVISKSEREKLKKINWKWILNDEAHLTEVKKIYGKNK